jgi:hypothetical protein
MGSSSTITKPENGVMRIAIEDLGAHVATLEAELRSVSAIELTRGETVIAEIHPKQVLHGTDTRPRPEMPDFMARMQENFGDKPLNVDTTAWIDEEREDRL